MEPTTREGQGTVGAQRQRGGHEELSFGPARPPRGGAEKVLDPMVWGLGCQMHSRIAQVHVTQGERSGHEDLETEGGATEVGGTPAELRAERIKEKEDVPGSRTVTWSVKPGVEGDVVFNTMEVTGDNGKSKWQGEAVWG